MKNLGDYLIPAIVVSMALVFMGSLWQLEIADLCLTNHWEFGFLFSFLRFPYEIVWAVRDFFMLLMVVAVLNISILALALWIKIRRFVK